MTEVVVAAGVAAVLWTLAAARRWRRRWDDETIDADRLQKLRDEVEGRRRHERG